MRPRKCLIPATIILFICAGLDAHLSIEKRPTTIKPTNISIYKQLEQIVDLSTLTLNTSFSDAIEILRNSTRPTLKIVVLWKDLAENADVYPNTPIYMDGISGIRLRKGLQLLLRSVSPRWSELDYIVEDGIVIIATKDALPARMITRIYDISDLTAPPAAFYTSARLTRARGIYGLRDNRRWDREGTIAVRALQQRKQRANKIAQLIKDSISPDSWR